MFTDEALDLLLQAITLPLRH